MLIYVVKDSDVLRRICLGLFTALILIKLICFSVAMFHTRQHQTFIARRNSDDDRFSRRSFAAPTRLLHAAPQSFRAHSSVLMAQSARFVGQGRVVSGRERNVDEPPPYHLALTLPLPNDNSVSVRPETPPPSYENTQLA
uniref:Uncharacterized protein n=1 Tax=Strigamia maritima TaxID=126957 RepID=T1IXN1_STRMM